MHVNILGTRGIPAAHGGFETFVGHFAPFLRDRGHSVVVYCQNDGEPGRPPYEDIWEGITRVHIAPNRQGAVGTMEFDWACVRDVVRRPGVDLVLGYNTAVFNLLEKLRGRRVAMNMDGIEWKRGKWGAVAKAWFYLNELAGANLADAVIVDHPEIARHAARRTTRTPVMIPYASDVIDSADPTAIEALGLVPDRYLVSIARAEPENSILELVKAFAGLGTDHRLVILGKLDPANVYHAAVRAAAGPGVLFPGAIYDPSVVQALRYHATAYLHGHTVGGTNPSLVEALGAGRPIIAHNNKYNRWTAGDGQFYFGTVEEARLRMGEVIGNPSLARAAGAAALRRHAEDFTWDRVHSAYLEVLESL